MARLLQKDEWVVYAAFLPALFTSAGIGPPRRWRGTLKRPGVFRPLARSVPRLMIMSGIARLPGYEFPAVDELSLPAAAIAAAELRVRNRC
jgi:hypothetical protein